MGVQPVDPHGDELVRPVNVVQRLHDILQQLGPIQLVLEFPVVKRMLAGILVKHRTIIL